MILLSSAVVLTAAELNYIFGYLRSYFKAGLKKPADVKTVLSQKKKKTLKLPVSWLGFRDVSATSKTGLAFRK